jgi:glycosyltransferase involved in cell wall biosynthesis
MEISKDTYLIVLPSLTLGGCETQGLFYARIISDCGIGTPIFVSLGREGELVPLLKHYNFKYFSFNSAKFHQSGRFKKILLIIEMVRFFRLLNPKYIIAQSYWPNLFAGVVWRFVGATRFFWIQGSVDSELGMTIWERLAKNCRPTYLANSQASWEFIKKRHDLRTNSPIIYNALDIPELYLKEKSECLQLIMVANFFPEKDFETLLIAFSSLIKSYPNCILHLVGKSPGSDLKMNKMKAHAFELKLGSKVIFHGPIKDVSVLLRNADIGILSTFSEGLSNSLLEYMAYGLPIVATNIDPNKEALGENNYRWLFTPKDVDKLTALLSKLCSDETLRKEIGEKNRERAIELFSFDSFQERFVLILRQN